MLQPFIMNFAIIDLGTNTFNLLVAKKNPDGKTFSKLFNTKFPVKLGESTINSGYISEKAYARGLAAINEYKRIIDEHNVADVYAFATSAVRTAANGTEFVDKIYQETSIKVQIIDGEEEAELIYYGNRMAVKMDERVSLIMDIGGGSNEFILANKDTIFWKESFMLGAARLLDKFKPSDPITEDEINRIMEYQRRELHPLIEAVKRYKPQELIGSSGAFDSVVDMISGQFNTVCVNEVDTEYDVNLDQYRYIRDKIIASTLKERYDIKGLIGMRADMMVISILLIEFILKEFGIQKMRVSTFSLKEGVIGRKLGLTL